MMCQNCQVAEGRRYTYRLHLMARLAVLCDGCRDRLTAMGLEFTPETRPAPTSPAWRDRLTPKDLTHA